jgi:hypothetical protein
LVYQMSDQSIEFFVNLSNKLSAEVARLEAEAVCRDKTLEMLLDADKKIAAWLAESHAYLDLLLGWMERAQGNIPLELRKLVTEARENLTLRQNAFLKEYGDWNKPGEN